jgi:hypothetical protein
MALYATAPERYRRPNRVGDFTSITITRLSLKNVQHSIVSERTVRNDVCEMCVVLCCVCVCCCVIYIRYVLKNFMTYCIYRRRKVA